MYYLEILKGLLVIIKHTRTDLEHQQLLHDNISVHTAVNVRTFLTKNVDLVLNHPHYPYHVPLDWHCQKCLLLKMKFKPIWQYCWHSNECDIRTKYCQLKMSSPSASEGYIDNIINTVCYSGVRGNFPYAFIVCTQASLLIKINSNYVNNQRMVTAEQGQLTIQLNGSLW